MSLSPFPLPGLVAIVVAVLFVSGCAHTEARPEGVGRGISFSVTPLYPKSFEIVAFGSRLRDAEELKVAWQKKAQMVAQGHRFKISSPVVLHSNESDLGGYLPILTRSATGTITLTD
jgi:hypothetical protein